MNHKNKRMSDKLFFNSRSSPVPAGTGTNEVIVNLPADPRYSKLPLNFRQILSNFWIAPFTLDGHRWASVEHYYHAQKFMTTHPQWAINTFSLDGKENIDPSKLAKGDPRLYAFSPVLSKSMGGKDKSHKHRPAEILADPMFFSPASAGIPGHPTWTRQDVAFFKGMCAKFSQHEDLKEVLENTGNAQLWHVMRIKREKWPRFWYLESIRSLHRQGMSCLMPALNNEPIVIEDDSSNHDEAIMNMNATTNATGNDAEDQDDSVPEYHN